MDKGRPGYALLELMASRGISSLGSRQYISAKKASSTGFQHMAVEMLVREYNMVYDYSYRGDVVYEEEFRGSKYRIVLGRGNHRSDAVLTQKPDARKLVATWKDIYDRLPNPPLPLFAVDMSMKFMHTEEEASKLRIQLAVALSVIRDYLWDPHLAITSIDRQTYDWLSEVMGVNKTTSTQSKPSELLWSMDADKVIVLRPDAPQPLTSNDILSADAFLVGGIVDRIPRPGMSRVLDNLVPWGLPRRIELRGSIVGVPERINRVIEIILKAKYLYPGDIERAIVSSMARKDVVARAYVEITRRARRQPGKAYVKWSLFDEMRRWLPITREEFLKAARRARVEVV